MFAGIVSLFMAMDVDAGAEIVTVPLLLAGLGIGALASQLGSVTVSAVPDDQSTEVGGLQNTATNLGASLGTALAGSLLIAMLTASFLQGIAENPAVPPGSPRRPASSSPVASRSSPTPTSRPRSPRPVRAAEVTAAVVDENEQARLDGLRVALAAARAHRAARPLLHDPDPHEAAGLGSTSARGPEPAQA